MVVRPNGNWLGWLWELLDADGTRIAESGGYLHTLEETKQDADKLLADPIQMEKEIAFWKQTYMSIERGWAEMERERRR
jgi:hypothetical protein